MVLRNNIADTKEKLLKDDFSFNVKNGAFGFDKITEVSIGVPFEYKNMSAEGAPIMVTYKNGDKNLASCLLEPSGDRRIRFYKEDGKSLSGRYILTGDKVYEWSIRNNQMLPLNNPMMADKAKQLSEISGKVWQNHLNGAYDKQMSAKTIVSSLRNQWNK